MNEIQTDYGYRWTYGFTDATAGEQFWQVNDLFSNIPRISIGQYNNGTANNGQTAINSAGTGAVVLNGSTNGGTGGVVVGSGGPTETTVATIDASGNLQTVGNAQIGGNTTMVGSGTVRNSANAEIDMTLWAGTSTPQKEAFIYKDYLGASQWYALNDTSDNWALNSATGGVDAVKAYQSTNSGDLYLNAAKSSGAVRVNYESGSGQAFDVYGGSSSSLWFAVTGAGAIKFPGLAASSGHYCAQFDSSGFLTNTGTACGTGSGSGSMTSYNITAPSWLSLSGCAVTTSGTCVITTASIAQGLFLASPSSGSGASVMRAIASADIPNNAANTSGSAASLSGSYSGNEVLASPAGSSGALSPRALVSGDIPNNAANTSGNASTATALAGTPTLCGTGTAPTGVTASGNATGCAALASAQWGTSASFTSTSATQYVGTSSLNNGSQSNPFVAPRSGTMQSCVVEISSAQSSTAYYTANLYKNGSLCSSGPTVTLNSTSANSFAADNTHTCSVSQGDRLSWQLVPTNTPATSVVSASCLY
jgi:hypothetical protein